LGKGYSPAGIQVSITAFRQMFLVLNSLEMDTEAFLYSLGFDPAILKFPEAHLQIESYLLIEEGVEGYTHDPYFGLHMGEFREKSFSSPTRI